MKRNDIKKVVTQYIAESEPSERFTSFDYCYNYFKNTDDYLANMEKSCLTLGFFLASWGMYRGSSFLLNKSLKHYVPIIEYLAQLSYDDRSKWDIDVDNYSDNNIKNLIKVYHELRNVTFGNESGQKAHMTLITKIMLGVFGSIPAYDNYFCNTFRNISTTSRFRVVNKDSLGCIRDFYIANKKDIDLLSSSKQTIDFLSSKKTDINYTKAKIIDMYGFMKNKQLKKTNSKSNVKEK